MTRNTTEFMRHNQNSRSTSILLPALGQNAHNMTHNASAAFNNKSSFYQRFMLNNRVAKTGGIYFDHSENVHPPIISRSLNAASNPYLNDKPQVAESSSHMNFHILPIPTTKSVSGSRSQLEI
jgi:hypothetical protein